MNNILLITFISVSGLFWQYSRAIEPTPKLDHVGISVSILEKEQAFYEKALGMKLVRRFNNPELPMRSVLLRADNGFTIELLERKNSKRDRPAKDITDSTLSLGYGHIALTVQNLENEFNELKAKGAIVVSAPIPASEKKSGFAELKDPEGNLIELVQPPLAP